MAMAKKLPSVLQQPNGNSLSMERALKQIRSLLEYGEFLGEEDKVDASIDDIVTMLTSLDRE